MQQVSKFKHMKLLQSSKNRHRRARTQKAVVSSMTGLLIEVQYFTVTKNSSKRLKLLKHLLFSITNQQVVTGLTRQSSITIKHYK